jgi:hypothetical protein
LHFETIHGHLQALVRTCGGWDGVRDELSPADRARLSIRLAEAAEREAASAENLARQQAEAEEVLNSPAMQRDLEQMALDWIRKHPAAAIRELAETPTGKRALRKAMKEASQGTS